MNYFGHIYKQYFCKNYCLEGTDMSVKKMSQPNSGIKCVVNTCDYYMAGDHCTAERIEVQHKNASTSQETDCATFIPGGQA